jgi:YD repeat-containing protein
MLASVASASETITYTYDALGRVTAVARNGGPNSGVPTATSYDPAGNRTNYTVGNTPPPPPGPVTFSISATPVTDAGTSAVFTVTKTGSATATQGVSYSTASGTAVSGTDFTPASGSFNFLWWETQKTVAVPTIAPTSAQPLKAFTMSLSNPTGGATLGTPSTATQTVRGDGCIGVSFSISSSTAFEGNPLNFAVTKSGSTSSNCSAHYATTAWTATAPYNYGAASGTLTFAPAQTSQNIVITTYDRNATNGSSRVMYVDLSSPTSGSSISSSRGTGTIRGTGGDQCPPEGCP